MSDKNFTKGVTVRTVETQYGEMLKVGIQFEKFKENPVNERGYINLVFKKAKSGKWYSENDTYKKQENQDVQQDIVTFSDDEIQF